MRIGIPTEIKNHEYRVGMAPAGVSELVHHGHSVLVQRGAGAGIGASDADYTAAGATLADGAQAVFAGSDMIIKVKEPQPQECALLRKDQLLFTYLHLAPDPQQAQALMASGCTAIAYETITDDRGGLPLLAPMSEVAGRMAIQVGAVSLQKANGGLGVLLGGVPGVPPGHVVIVGGGVVGYQAALMATGLGARVTILDRSLPRLRWLDDQFKGRAQAIYATQQASMTAFADADLIVGAVLVPGAAAPKLIRRADLSRLKPGCVLVDVAIDQGGCFETSRATTHQDPTFVVDGILHYCVANMPGAVPRTSTHALNNATLPYALALADKGWQTACRDNAHLARGLNVHAGAITCPEVAQELGLPLTRVEAVLG
ncbi:alanine dehydrogenase [Amphibiibacter pelophylacis]|uniref:Alanine dehydrogenase n=1 Tax=Amphibiibacter pelophylacis TaxID=1799477 RepID=A0ACC6P3X6_9BURK